MTMGQQWAKRVFVTGLDRLQGGSLQLAMGGDRSVHGDGRPSRAGQSAIEAVLQVDAPRFFWRALTRGDIGLGEAYMDGDWTTPDLVALIRLMLRNLALVDDQAGALGVVPRLFAALARRLRDNSLNGSRRHIHRHYDLGNDFFRLFLDEQLMYSCALYRSDSDSLEAAQQNKLDHICRKLDLSSSDHVLEIGTGWGGFAAWAATRYGCRVTTATISAEQYRFARERMGRLGEAGQRVNVLLQDYRELRGTFDKIVSIEMFEAVGLNHYDEFFGAADRLLNENGSMLLQTITVNDQYFPRYHRSADWIEKYIFPGGELASVQEIIGSLARTTTLSMHHAENIGVHYARTLREWRARFHAQRSRVMELGFDDRFIRMWDLYLAYSEAAFLERHAGDLQLLLTRNYSTRQQFNEPWAGADAVLQDDESAVA